MLSLSNSFSVVRASACRPMWYRATSSVQSAETSPGSHGRLGLAQRRSVGVLYRCRGLDHIPGSLILAGSRKYGVVALLVHGAPIESLEPTPGPVPGAAFGAIRDRLDS
jgi:hypothetical protein